MNKIFSREYIGKIVFLFVNLVLILTTTDFARANTLRIYLYYDATKDNIGFDQFAVHPVSLDTEKVVHIPEFDEQYASPGPYEILFTDPYGNIIDQKQFTPTKGTFVIDAPDYHITKTIIVRKVGTTNPIAQQDISQYISCNRNGTCEFEKGETIDSCIPDCASKNVYYSDQTQAKLDASQGVIRDPKTGDILLNNVKPTPIDSSITKPARSNSGVGIIILLFVSLFAIVGFGLWYFLRHRE